jgi:hypothetical protein
LARLFLFFLGFFPSSRVDDNPLCRKECPGRDGSEEGRDNDGDDNGAKGVGEEGHCVFVNMIGGREEETVHAGGGGDEPADGVVEYSNTFVSGEIAIFICVLGNKSFISPDRRVRRGGAR